MHWFWVCDTYTVGPWCTQPIKYGFRTKLSYVPHIQHAEAKLALPKGKSKQWERLNMSLDDHGLCFGLQVGLAAGRPLKRLSKHQRPRMVGTGFKLRGDARKGSGTVGKRADLKRWLSSSLYIFMLMLLMFVWWVYACIDEHWGLFVNRPLAAGLWLGSFSHAGRIWICVYQLLRYVAVGHVDS